MDPIDKILMESEKARLAIVVPAAEHLTPLDWGRRAVVIDPEAALYHADRVRALHTRTLADAALVLGGGVFFDGWRKMSHGPRALVGRIDLHHKLLAVCAPSARIVHRNPEDGLHPKHCCELGDLFLRWTKTADLPPGLDNRT